MCRRRNTPSRWICVLLILAIPVVAEDAQPAKDAASVTAAEVKLNQAKADHAKVVADQQKRLLTVIDQRIKVAQKAGNLKLVQTYQAMKEQAESDDGLSGEIKDAIVRNANKRYGQAVLSANKRLLAAYKIAIRNATKAGNIKVAERFQSELDNFDPNATLPAGPMFRLGGRLRVPSYMEVPRRGVTSTPGGLRSDRGSYIRTKKSDHLKRNFVYEVLFTFEKEKNGIAFVGIGPALGGSAYNEPTGSVHLRIHPPHHNGEVALARGSLSNQKGVGKIPNSGQHLVRMEKRGDTLRFMIDVNHDGRTDNDLEHTIENLREFAPFLNNSNSHLFFGAGATFIKMRLIAIPD